MKIISLIGCASDENINGALIAVGTKEPYVLSTSVTVTDLAQEPVNKIITETLHLKLFPGQDDKIDDWGSIGHNRFTTII